MKPLNIKLYDITRAKLQLNDDDAMEFVSSIHELNDHRFENLVTKEFLSEKINDAPNEEERQKLGKIRYEINSARQAKLKEADNLLRDILSAGGAGENFEIKKMEARLLKHMRNSEIDMAFMVILQLNIEDANRSNATMAVQIMKHMETLIHEHQDNIVSPPVRLMRMLVRTEDLNVRKQMMRQKLLIGKNAEVAASDPAGEAVPLATDTPQCMHIVVEPVQRWGAADVTPKELQDTIDDVMSQVIDMKIYYSN